MWLQPFFSCDKHSIEPLNKVAYYYNKIHRQVYLVDLERTKFIGQYRDDSVERFFGTVLSKKSGRLFGINPNLSAQYSEIISFDPVTHKFEIEFKVPEYLDYPAISPDGSVLCGFSWDWDSIGSGPPKSIVVVDMEDRSLVKSVSLEAHRLTLKYPQELAISRSGDIAAFVDPGAPDAPFCLVDLISDKVEIYPFHSGFPLEPVFTADEQSCYLIEINQRIVVRIDLASRLMSTVYTYDTDWIPDILSVPNSDKLIMRYNTTDRTANRIVVFNKNGQIDSRIDLPYPVSARSDFTSDSILCLIAVPSWYNHTDRYNVAVVGVPKQYSLIYLNVNNFSTHQVELVAPQEMYYSDEFFINWK
jgi:hypothetical protein